MSATVSLPLSLAGMAFTPSTTRSSYNGPKADSGSRTVSGSASFPQNWTAVKDALATIMASNARKARQKRMRRAMIRELEEQAFGETVRQYYEEQGVSQWPEKLKILHAGYTSNTCSKMAESFGPASIAEDGSGKGRDVYCMRHSETHHNVIGSSKGSHYVRTGGKWQWVDMGDTEQRKDLKRCTNLTEKGIELARRQGKTLQADLKAKGKEIGLYVVSELPRTHETLEEATGGKIVWEAPTSTFGTLVNKADDTQTTVLRMKELNEDSLYLDHFDKDAALNAKLTWASHMLTERGRPNDSILVVGHGNVMRGYIRRALDSMGSDWVSKVGAPRLMSNCDIATLGIDFSEAIDELTRRFRSPDDWPTGYSETEVQTLKNGLKEWLDKNAERVYQEHRTRLISRAIKSSKGASNHSPDAGKSVHLSRPPRGWFEDGGQTSR